MLLIAQPTTEGVARCVAQLACAGVKFGFHVRVACPSDGDLATEVTNGGAEWINLPLRRHPEMRDLRWLVRVRSLLNDVDLVHLHSAKAGAIGRLAGSTMTGRRPPLLFTPHGWSWLAGGQLAPAYRAFERVAARLADVVITVSDDERELGTPVLGPALQRVRVIENGVDLDAFSPTGPVRSTRTPSVVCVGRLSVQKGQDLAISALSMLRHDDARLRLVGTGPERPRLVALAEALGVPHRLDWMGGNADVATEIRSATVVVVPSRWDGLSLSLLEAMACGAAVVATRVSGSSALEGVGVLTAPERPRMLAEAIDGLIDEPSRRAELGHAARQRAVERFDLRDSLASILELWREVAS